MRTGAGSCTAAAVAVAVLCAGCGTAAPVVEDVPVAVASEVEAPPGMVTARPSPSPRPAPDATADATPPPADESGTAPAGPAGPTAADAAAFVDDGIGDDLRGLEHVVTDLDGDGVDEVVATGMEDRDGVLRVAWWQDGAYTALAEGRAGRGRRVEDLRVADVNRDGVVEVLVTVVGEGLRSLAVWGVPEAGRLDPLEAVGGCHDGSHVYGVTRAGLESQVEGPPVLVADCDESPLPVADWVLERWAWSDGAYRHVEPQPTPAPTDGADDDEDDGDGDDGDDGDGDGDGRGDDEDDGGGEGQGPGGPGEGRGPGEQGRGDD